MVVADGLDGVRRRAVPGGRPLQRLETIDERRHRAEPDFCTYLIGTGRYTTATELHVLISTVLDDVAMPLPVEPTEDPCDPSFNRALEYLGWKPSFSVGRRSTPHASLAVRNARPRDNTFAGSMIGIRCVSRELFRPVAFTSWTWRTRTCSDRNFNA